MVPYLKLDHIDKTFSRGSHESDVLRDITLGIERGEYVSIIGHSGCGKTTLLNIVAGLVPVTRGAVLLENREVNDPGPDRAVVFQNHSLLPWLTVYGNVRMAVDKVFGGARSRAHRHDWTMHNLELVQMAHAKDKRPAEISGGMKQRVGLARALAMEPKVLAARRAVRRARCAHPRVSPGLGDGDPPEARQHGADDHPRCRRGGAALRSHRDDDQRPRGAGSARCSTFLSRGRADGSSCRQARPI